MKLKTDIFIVLVTMLLAIITLMIGVITNLNWLIGVGVILFLIAYYLYSKLEDNDNNV